MSDTNNSALDDVKPINDNPQGATDKPVEPQRNPQDGPPPSNAERAARAEQEAAGNAKDDTKAKPEDNPDGNRSPDIKEGEADDEPELDTSVWGDGEGDDVTVSLLTTLQNSGVKPEEAKALLFDAIQQGDPSKVDRDALVEKVGKHKATLIMAGVENVTARIQHQIKQTTEVVHSAAGGRDNWDKARKWAQSGIQESELNEYRDMISKGGKQAEFAVAQIVKAYNADPKNTSLNAKATTIVGDGGGKADPRKGISRNEYYTRKEKLHRRGRPSQAQLAELRELRNLGKKQGL